MTGQKLRWYQIAGLALAGLASFALPVYWSMASDRNSDDLVQVVVRNRTSPAATPVMPAPVRTSLEAAQAPGENPLQMSARSEHVSGQVAHNPFGNLNLLADAELAAGRSPGAAVRTPTSAQARKPKVEPPPPVAMVVEAPPPPLPPTAPSLPFAVVGGISGQQITEGHPVAFLRLRDEVLVVRPGDEIDKIYRVESITLEKIEFTYLPLQQRP